MADYTLYCFAQSGNAYKAALMLNLCGADWQPRLVDYFNGEQRTPAYRALNEMGEVPVLEHAGRRLSQTGVILDYLAQTFGKYGWADEDERREILRWLLWDNHKLTSYTATLRFLVTYMKTGETPVTEFLRGRSNGALAVLNDHLDGRDFVLGAAADDRRHLDVRLSVLARGDRRELDRLSAHRRLARADQSPARLGPPLRADAGPSAAVSVIEQLRIAGNIAAGLERPDGRRSKESGVGH